MSDTIPTPETYTERRDLSGVLSGYTRASDGAFVPIEDGNRDYQLFLRQQAAGVATIQS